MTTISSIVYRHNLYYLCILFSLVTVFIIYDNNVLTIIISFIMYDIICKKYSYIILYNIMCVYIIIMY